MTPVQASAASSTPNSTISQAATGQPLNLSELSESVRAECIRGRRVICGKVLEIVKGGLIVESGYTSLLRPPLTQSWVAPATVAATRDPNAIESTEPGAVCVGTIFLTDVPRSPVPHQFDYVTIMGYPAGIYSYSPVPSITNEVRRFSAGLETAVNLNSK